MMRFIAVVANMAQMAIVLLVFLLNGFSLGGWTIIALFVLLMIAFANLIMFLFHSALFQKDASPATKDKGIKVKRQDLRVTYISEPYPTLMVGKRKFSVSDLSENGLRIRIGPHEQLKKRFRGHLVLLCDESVAVKLNLIRRQGDEVALALKEPIDYAILLREKQVLAV